MSQLQTSCLFKTEDGERVFKTAMPNLSQARPGTTVVAKALLIMDSELDIMAEGLVTFGYAAGQLKDHDIDVLINIFAPLTSVTWTGAENRAFEALKTERSDHMDVAFLDMAEVLDWLDTVVRMAYSGWAKKSQGVVSRMAALAQKAAEKGALGKSGSPSLQK